MSWSHILLILVLSAFIVREARTLWIFNMASHILLRFIEALSVIVHFMAGVVVKVQNILLREVRFVRLWSVRALVGTDEHLWWLSGVVKGLGVNKPLRRDALVPWRCAGGYSSLMSWNLNSSLHVNLLKGNFADMQATPRSVRQLLEAMQLLLVEKTVLVCSELPMQLIVVSVDVSGIV